MTTFVIYSPSRSAYWRQNEWGYTDLADAGRFSAEQIARLRAQGRLDGDEVIEVESVEGVKQELSK